MIKCNRRNNVATSFSSQGLHVFVSIITITSDIIICTILAMGGIRMAAIISLGGNKGGVAR